MRSCGHPEWPAVVVRGVEDGRAAPEAHPSFARVVHPAVAGGNRVRVVMAEEMMRMETTGVAQGSGQVGDRVWVRIAAPDGQAGGRLELAVVRSADVLEIAR